MAATQLPQLMPDTSKVPTRTSAGACTVSTTSLAPGAAAGSGDGGGGGWVPCGFCPSLADGARGGVPGGRFTRDGTLFSRSPRAAEGLRLRAVRA
jgi:hypothetical protein